MGALGSDSGFSRCGDILWAGEVSNSHTVNVNQVDDGCSPDQTQLDSSESSHSLQARLSKEHL